MRSITDITGYHEALASFSKEQLWALFDGNRSDLNIGHECIDRHPPDRLAVHIIDSKGHDERYTFGELRIWSNRFANYLTTLEVARGSPIAIMLEPSLAFYASLFGSMKAGCIAVPMFTLFGPEGMRLRLDDCAPKLFLGSASNVKPLGEVVGRQHVVVDDDFMAILAAQSSDYDLSTSADDMAVYQYTSGTTRQLPEAIEHRHRAIVTVILAALYGTGVRPHDHLCCPSSPAWGHGLWHGTLAPLAMGASVSSYRGKFDPLRLFEALEQSAINNLSAAATHYRMLRQCPRSKEFRHSIEKLSFTGEPIDSETASWVADHFGQPACSIYGTTEVGVILVSYPGAKDFEVKPEALGKPIPGREVAIIDESGEQTTPGVKGEIVVRRGNDWFKTKDIGYTDEEGYFYHAGRADDVIISAGYTMSAVEIEDVLLQHNDVSEVAVVALPDANRGQIPKAFVVSLRNGDNQFVEELQELARTRLSLHEYPRAVTFVDSLPKLPAGKINRKALREYVPTSTQNSARGT
ncbi:MAG TPA: acetate--CoA ligase [Gammaproteobacteria bacterium]|nr:acetate--CoA ligase [Gammaproteobacteria bacterium]